MTHFRKILISFFLLLFTVVFVLAAVVLLRGAILNHPSEQTGSFSAPTEITELPNTHPELSETTVPQFIPTTEAPETQPVETQPTEETAPERIHYDSVPLFYQTDYPDTLFGNGTIASSGACITSLAMVATYLTGYEYTPDVLADYFGGYGQNNIQRLDHASDMLQLPWKRASDVRETLAAVRDGSLAIVLLNQNSYFTGSEHFIVLAGVNEEGKLLVNDPYQPNYSKWNLKDGFSSGFSDTYIIQGYSGGWIYDASAMPEDPFIYIEEKPDVEPRYPDISLTEEERTLLAKVIWVEARGESAEGQQAIAEVIFNRMVSDSFPNTLQTVLFSFNQFPSTEYLDEAKPSQAQYDAIKDALSGPYILPIDVYHFATYPVNENVWGSIGSHIFCYQSS